MPDVHSEHKQEMLDIPFVDKHQVEVLLEKASRDPDEELKTHFIRNIFANLEGILEALTDEEAPLKERLARLLQAAQAVEDLAMIHGYDGIETIAQNMVKAISAVDPRAYTELPELLTVKVKMAVEAIQKVLSLSDELKERVIVDSTTSQISELDRYTTISQASEKAEVTSAEPEFSPEESGSGKTSLDTEDHAPQATDVSEVDQEDTGLDGFADAGSQNSWPLADSLTNLLDDEVEEPDSAVALETPPEETSQEGFNAVEPTEDVRDDEPVFDIKEASALIELMSEEGENSEVDSLETAESKETPGTDGVEGHDGVATHDLETSAVPTNAVEDLFADVLRDEAKETLIQLNQLLTAKGKVKEEVVENTIFVLESLRETAEKLHYQDVANCAAELLTLTGEKVKAGSPLDDTTRELFTQASKALREFVEGSPSAGTRLGLLVERMRGERSPEAEEDALDDAIIMELQRKLAADQQQKSGGLKGKLKKIFGR